MLYSLLAVLFCTLYQIYIKCGTLLETSLSCGVPAFAEILVPPHKIRLSDGKTMDAWLDRISDSLEIAQTASMIFCSGWPRSAGLLARSDDAHACREAVQLSRTSTTSTQPVLQHKSCISILRELSTDILSFRDSLRSCLSNAPPTLQQRWRVQPDAVLRQYSSLCHTLTHMGTGGGYL